MTQSLISGDPWLKVFWKLSAPHLLFVTMALPPRFLYWAALYLVAWLPLRAMNAEEGGDDGGRPRDDHLQAHADDGMDRSRERGDFQGPSSSSPSPHPGAGLPSSSSTQSPAASSSSSTSSLRPWSPRTVALYMAAVWDENFSLAAQLDPTEDNSSTLAPLYFEQLSRGMHELAPCPEHLPLPSLHSAWSSSSRPPPPALYGVCPRPHAPTVPVPPAAPLPHAVCEPAECEEHDHHSAGPGLPPPAAPEPLGEQPHQGAHLDRHPGAPLLHAPAAPVLPGGRQHQDEQPPEPVPVPPAEPVHQGECRAHRSLGPLPNAPAVPGPPAEDQPDKFDLPPGAKRGRDVDVPPEGSPPTSSSSSTSSPAGAAPGLPDWLELVRDRRNLRSGGVTTRFGLTRSGVDRWHYKDGSIRNRRQETLARERLLKSRIPPAIPEGDVDNDEAASPAAPSHAVEGGDGTDPVDGVALPCSTTAYGEKFTTCNDPRPAGPVDGGSTTAPEEGDLADVDSASSSSDAPTSQVGFWRNGQWIGRPRTAAELRAHRGGGGEQRTQSRQQRMDDYFQGRWKPAWLVSYIQEKAQRQSRPAVAPPPTPPTSSTNNASSEKQPGSSDQSVWDRWCRTDWPSDEELSAQAHPGKEDETWENTTWPEGASWKQWTGSTWTWSAWEEPSPSQGWQTWDNGAWGDWSSDPALRGDWTDWSTISSPWTSSSTTIVPNAGLFPEVRELGQEADDDEAAFMQLTGAERRRMQENGVPDHVQDRVEHLMEALHQHQENDRGPEARWALQRLRLRAEEGVQCLEAILEIMGRRMMPRGFWPVERRPQTAEDQARWMAWIRQWQKPLPARHGTPPTNSSSK